MRRGLITARLASAAQVDMTSCPDVQAFIQQKVNHEAFVKWCREETTTELRPDTLTYPRVRLFTSLTALLP